MRTPLPRAIEAAARRGRWLRRHPADAGSLFAGLLVVAVVKPPVPIGGAAGLVALAVVIVCAGADWRIVFRVLLVPVVFILASGLAVAYDPGAGFVGTEAAIRASIRALSACACLAGLILTVPPSRLFAGHVPKGFRTFADILFIQHRFIIRGTDMRINLSVAARARGGDRGFSARLRTSVGIARALMARMVGAATDVRRGLAARGYGGGRLRIASGHEPPSPTFIGVSLALCAVLIALPGGAG